MVFSRIPFYLHFTFANSSLCNSVIAFFFKGYKLAITIPICSAFFKGYKTAETIPTYLSILFRKMNRFYNIALIENQIPFLISKLQQQCLPYKLGVSKFRNFDTPLFIIDCITETCVKYKKRLFSL
jgi:hypothetical protein